MGRHRSPVRAKPTRADRKQIAGRSLLVVDGAVLTVLVLWAAWASAVHALTVAVLVASAGYVVGTVLCWRAGETTLPHVLCGALSLGLGVLGGCLVAVDPENNVLLANLGVLMFTPGSGLLLAGYGDPFLAYRRNR